jgi:LysM repeat protein
MRLTLIFLSLVGSLTVFAQQSFDYESYTVKKGDTYYSISRAYNITVDALKTANKNEALKAGQRLFIPKTNSPKTIVKTEESTKQSSKDSTVYYKVKQGDNLYRIALIFGVSAKDIQEANQLSSFDIKVGQTLKIKNPTSGESSTIDSSKENNTQSSKDINPFNLPGNEVRSLVSNVDEITQRGMVGLIENKGLERTTNSFALHKHIKPGTIIKLTNIENNHKVLVKVVGTLPDIPENEKVIMKISSTAAEYIGVKGTVFLAQITYAQKR